jgi:hypothetical protein
MRKKINFNITAYKLEKTGAMGSLIIEGYKLPPPSKRITIHQKNIKVLNAKIIYKHKKGDIEVEVTRINHIKSFQEVRIHTLSSLYPGNYVIFIEYTGSIDENKLKEN